MFVGSPVDKSFMEGMQYTSTIKPFRKWFGKPPQSVTSTADKGISRLHVYRDACKGSTDTQRGNSQGKNLKIKNGKLQNVPEP
ncbi:MAG: hypothetical protein ACP5L4_00005 [Thermoplasmata archaeon]